MGSSKKHKDKDRERRHKHRHRSEKSRSRSGSRERKKHEKRRKKEEVEDDDYLYGREELENSYVPVPSSSRNRQDSSENASSRSMPPASGDGSSLSIEETNKIRAKLGLKPLEIKTQPTGEGTGRGDDEDVHAPPLNLSEMRRTQDLRAKMELQKEKRRISSKLRSVKTLGESDSEEDMKSWIKKSRKIGKEKAMAEKRAKLLEEMDAEFGIGDLVEEEFKGKEKKYSSRHLKGLKVQHGMENFKEGQTVILTLQDQGVLEDGEEVLYNVNIKDDEFAKKNIENKKKKIDYKPYDEPEYDEYGMVKAENVLSKYDEEIGGEQKESFTLGSGGKYNAEHERNMERIRSQLRQQGQSLSMAAPTLATEYYSKEEMDAKFKKVKKKIRKIRKKPKSMKADDLVPLTEELKNEDFGSRARGRGMQVVEEEEVGAMYDPITGQILTVPQKFDYNHGLPLKTETEDMEIDKTDFEEAEILGPDEDLTGVAVDEDTAEQELHAALTKARKLKQAKKGFVIPKKEIEAVDIKTEPDMDVDLGSSMIVLNSTSEFCRSLGDIPTYGLSGNRDEERDELLDQELELLEKRKREEEEGEGGTGWSAVDVDTRPVNINEEEKAVLDDEPLINQGLGAALSLAMTKGYLEKEVKKKGTAPKHEHIQAQNYSIEDKRYEDLDDKYRKRDRFSGGAVVDFKEKDLYRPEIKLEYVDEHGRNLSKKEAFRQLSHRFHGKGSGKKKTEKRMKKIEEENLMLQMSSTDTPLGTLNLLKEKQRAEKSAYVLLTGSKGMAANTIVKTS